MIDGNGLDDVTIGAQSVGIRLDDDEALRVLDHARKRIAARKARDTASDSPERRS